MALEFERRDTVFGLRDQVHGDEPFGQRELAGLEDGAAEQAALVAAATALEVTPGRSAKLAVPGLCASRAQEALRPTPLANECLALFLAAIGIEEFKHRQTVLVLHLVHDHRSPPVVVRAWSQVGSSWREPPPGRAEHSC